MNRETAYEIVQPKGYIGMGGKNPRPWFDDEDRIIVLLCHSDGSVTWEMRSNGKVVEPKLQEEHTVTANGAVVHYNEHCCGGIQ